ncbi:MAG TPA: hypothetical protein PK562_02755 [Candidatus Omnitrophota bacterium]|nr:hypothetical protein [Candidatus Omnitrophota bacterium]
MTFAILLFAALVSVAILYTYPLAFSMRDRLAGFEQTDTYLSVWNIWHLKKALAQGIDFFRLRSDFIFYPQRPPLFLHNNILTSGLLSLPFQAFFSPIVSMNLVFFLQFILTGAGMYMLVSYYSRSRFAGLWAGLTLAFCPYVIMQSCYFLHFSSVWFFPWFILFFWKFLGHGRLRYGIGAAIVYALCLLEDQTYFLFLTLLAVFMVIFFSARKHKTLHSGFRTNAAISAALFLALSSWYLSGLIRATAAVQTRLPVWPDAAIDYFSIHWAGFLRPSPLLAAYRALPALATPIAHVTNAFVGYVPLFFACLALVRFNRLVAYKKKIVLFWVITGTIFYLLAAGPLLFGHHANLRALAPYNLLCIGPLRQMRIPVRFALVTFICVYIVAGFGVEQFMRMKRLFIKSSVCVGTFLIILQIIEFLPAPYPLLDLTVPQVYVDLAHRDKGSPVLVLPLGWQTSYKSVGYYNKETQYFQTVHEHPIFQGQIARIDDKYIDYYTSQPGFKYLMEAHFRSPTLEEQADVYRILMEYGIKNVVISTKYFSPNHLKTIQDVLAKPLLNKELQINSY